MAFVENTVAMSGGVRKRSKKQIVTKKLKQQIEGGKEIVALTSAP
jgi:hypothetical protein